MPSSLTDFNTKDVEEIEGDIVDVYLGEVDPLTYNIHQIEGMIISLLYGAAPLNSLRKHAKDFAKILHRDLRSHSLPDHQAQSLSTTIVPVIDVERKQARQEGEGEGGDAGFMENVDRLMYDTKIRHNEANSALWELWYPYVEKSAELDLTASVTLSDESCTDAIVMSKSQSTSSAFCSTARLLGGITRNYLSDEHDSMMFTRVYDGDNVNKIGDAVLASVYGYLESGRSREEFDPASYFQNVTSLSPGTKVRAYPPGEYKMEALLSAHRYDRYLAGKVSTKTDNVLEVEVSDDDVITIDVSNVNACLSNGWFIYEESSARKNDIGGKRFRGLEGGSDVILLRRSGDIDYQSVLLHLAPSVLDKTASLDPDTQLAVTNMRQVEHILRTRFGDEIREEEAFWLRRLIENNIDRMMLSSDDDQKNEIVDSSAYASQNKQKKTKTKTKATVGKRIGGNNKFDGNLNEFLALDDPQQQPPPAEYYITFHPVENPYDDVTKNRPLYLYGSADRGMLHLLVHIERELEKLARYAGSFTASGRQQLNRSKSGGDGGDENDGIEQGEKRNSDLPVSCEDRPFITCVKKTLQDMALVGFNDNKDNSSHNGKDGRCIKVSGSAGEDSSFTAFLFSNVSVGEHGRGYVVDRLVRAGPRCLEDARKRAMTVLREKENAIYAAMAAFDHTDVRNRLANDIRGERKKLTLHRKTPIVIWPQFEIPNSDFSQIQTRHVPSSLEEGGVFHLTFDDKAHYAPISEKPTSAAKPSASASDDPRNDDSDSFVSLFIEENTTKNIDKAGKSSVYPSYDDPVVLVARGAGKLAAVIEKAPQGRKETNAERSDRESQPVKHLAALAKLRNPPEKVMHEVHRQVQLLRQKKDDIVRRAPSAAKNYEEFEAKIVERIKRQVKLDHARNTFMTAVAIVNSASMNAPPLRRLVEIATDALKTFLLSGGVIEKEEDAIRESAIQLNDVEKEVDIVKDLLSRSYNNDNPAVSSLPENQQKKREEETSAWPGFRPKMMTRTVPSDTKDGPSKLVNRINLSVKEQTTKTFEEPTGDKKKKDKEERGGGGRGRGREREGEGDGISAEKTTSHLHKSTKLVTSACCLSKITRDIDHFSVYGDDVREFIRREIEHEISSLHGSRLLSADSPQTLERRYVEKYASYPDKTDIIVEPGEFEIIGIGNDDSGERSTNDVSDDVGSLAGFQAANPAYSGDSLLNSLAAAIRKGNPDERTRSTEKAAGNILQETEKLWKHISDKATMHDKVSSTIWSDLFNTSDSDNHSQREAAIILKGFIQNGLSATLNDMAFPLDSVAMKTKGGVPSASDTKVHQERLAIKDGLARLEPVSLFHRARKTLQDVVHRKTKRVMLVPDAMAGQAWVSCAVLGYITCKSLVSILNMTDSGKGKTSNGNENINAVKSEALSMLAANLVSMLCDDLYARFQFSHDDVRFDEIIAAQREEEKRKKLDLYKQMTEDELESLRTYKNIADFDERRLQDFIHDRRKGAAKLSSSSSSSDGDTNEGEEQTAEKRHEDMNDDEPFSPPAEKIIMEDHEEQLGDDDDEDSEYEADDID
jgi:hypothetical protein